MAQTTVDPRAWRADTIDKPVSWYYPLAESCLAMLNPTVEQAPETIDQVTALRLPDSVRAACAEQLQPVSVALESGRGFAVIDSIPVERYSRLEATSLYWLIGQALGVPFEQNTQGTLLYDVRDTGQSVQYGARFSVTNAESSFHTDNSFGDTILDYVGLLSLRSAKSGGQSQVVSGYAVVQELANRHPDALEILSQPFHIDRRGGVRDGEAPTAHHPIIDWENRGLCLRYLRYWIEAGHEKAREPLTPEQVRALDSLDAVANRREFRVDFALRPGQMFFINNRWILHNRTAFEDHAEPENRRHYVRLWLMGE
jgi:alpha-ketoglutarate-dependent taurine dioxygenase